MIKVSVMYPAEAGARFDWDYYLEKHAALVGTAFTPHGLRKVQIDRGVDSDGPAPYIAIAHLYFDSVEAWGKAAGEAAGPVMADIPNYTSVSPAIQVSEVLSD